MLADRWTLASGCRDCPPAQEHSLPDVNLLPDVAELPDVTQLPDVNVLPDDSASGCELASGCEFQCLSTSIPPCQIISTEAPPRVHGAHLGPLLQ